MRKVPPQIFPTTANFDSQSSFSSVLQDLGPLEKANKTERTTPHSITTTKIATPVFPLQRVAHLDNLDTVCSSVVFAVIIKKSRKFPANHQLSKFGSISVCQTPKYANPLECSITKRIKFLHVQMS